MTTALSAESADVPRRSAVARARAISEATNARSAVSPSTNAHSSSVRAAEHPACLVQGAPRHGDPVPHMVGGG